MSGLTGTGLPNLSRKHEFSSADGGRKKNIFVVRLTTSRIPYCDLDFSSLWTEPDSVAAGRGLSGIFPSGRGGHVGSAKGKGRGKGGGRGAGGGNPGRGKERRRPLGNDKDQVTKAASPKLTLILFEVGYFHFSCKS